MGDFVIDHTAAAAIEGIEEREYNDQLREALEAALEAIPEKCSQVIQLRYMKNQSLAEAGDVIGVSCERIRQLENKGIKLLRESEHACNLYPFYEFDFYCGTGLRTFENQGMSVQEQYLVIMENRRMMKEKRLREQNERKLAEILKECERRQ